MGNLVRDGFEDPLPLRLAGACRIDQKCRFEIQDRAPVLHCREELARARCGNHVELWKWVRRAEVLVVPGQYLADSVECELCLDAGALARHHAYVHAADRSCCPLQVADRHVQQIRRHLRRRLEADMLFRADDATGRFGHVRESVLLGGNHDFECKGRLRGRLVPHRYEATSVHGFKLRREHALRALLRGVIHGKHSRGAGADPARERQRKLMGPGFHIAWKCKRRRLCGRVQRDVGGRESVELTSLSSRSSALSVMDLDSSRTTMSIVSRPR